MDYGPILLVFAVLNCILTIWAIRVIGMAIEKGMTQLDMMLAGTIQKLLEGDVLGSLEPVNPIQAAIAQMLTNRIENAPLDLSRAADGKFSSEKIS